MSFNKENMDVSGTFTGKSIDAAKQKAAEEFNVDLSLITFEVINDVKKGIFGKVKEEAKVWAGYNYSKTEDDVNEEHSSPEEPIEVNSENIQTTNNETIDNNGNDSESKKQRQIKVCSEYLKNILDKMNIEASLDVTTEDNVICINIDSKGSGAVIGRRGENLDSLQYLCSLVINKCRGEFKRVNLDSCGYREKREETLVKLASKIAQKAIKMGRATTLEPMNPYERRIIHSTISDIEGVNSKSIGEEPYRKVIISPENIKNNGGYKKKRTEGPRSLDLKTSFEKDYKKPKPEDDINAGLYGKIEL